MYTLGFDAFRICIQSVHWAVLPRHLYLSHVCQMILLARYEGRKEKWELGGDYE